MKKLNLCCERKKSDRILLLLSFLIPLAAVCIYYILNGIAPFGDNTLLVSDARGQYSSFWNYYRDLLFGEQDLFYAFEKPLGGSMVGLFAYYLASPFNLIFALFPETMLPVALHLIVALKLAFCGLTFAVMIDKTRGMNWMTLILSTSYALCAYNVCFCWCEMWLDGVILLPLIALGLHYIAEGKRPWLYVFSLAGAIITCYYIGFMLCIFSVLFFIYLTAVRSESIKKVDMRNVWTFAASSAAAGAVSAFILLPALLSMTGGKREPMSSLLWQYIIRYAYPVLEYILPDREGQYDSIIKTAIIFGAVFVAAATVFVVHIFASGKYSRKLKVMTAVLAALAFFGYDIVRERYILICFAPKYMTIGEITFGMPKLYVGIIPLVLAVLYFFCSGVGKKEKIASGLLCTVMFISMSSLAVNMIWHGFTENHSFNYRYSFIFSFIVLILADRAMDELRQMTAKPLIISTCAAAVLSAAAAVLCPETNTVACTAAAVVVSAAFFAVIYLLQSGRMEKYAWAPVGAALAVILIFCADFGYITGREFSAIAQKSASAAEYRQKAADYELENNIKYIENHSGEFYRTKKTYRSFGQNDPMMFGYDGVSHFSSTDRTSTIDLLRESGMTVYGSIWASAEESGFTRAMDSMWGIKYVITEEGSYRDYTTSEEREVVVNPYVLPTGIVCGELPEAEDVRNPFSFINQYYCAVFGSDRPVFAAPDKVTVTADAENIISGSDISDLYIKDTVECTVDISSDDYLYFYAMCDDAVNLTVCAGGDCQSAVITAMGNASLCLGKFTPGETVTVTIASDKAATVSYMCFCFEDSEALKMYHDIAEAQHCVTSKQSDAQVKTEVTVDDASYVIYSIPFDESWRVSVDGEHTAACMAMGSLIAVPLSAGTHVIELKYVPRGLTAGCVISAAALLCVGYFVYDEQRRKSKKL